MTDKPSIKISRVLQNVASGLERALEIASEEPAGFLLIVTTSDGIAQHVTNYDRESLQTLVGEFALNVASGVPDVPAHLNQNLYQTTH